MKGDIIAVFAFVAVLLGFVTAVLGFIAQRRAVHAVVVAEKTAGKVQEISVNVDGRLSAMMERQSQLLGALHQADVPVPPKTAEMQERKILCPTKSGSPATTTMLSTRKPARSRRPMSHRTPRKRPNDRFTCCMRSKTMKDGRDNEPEMLLLPEKGCLLAQYPQGHHVSCLP